MFYSIKFIIILIIMFTNLRKCEIVKHKIVFKNVGNRFPKILTIFGFLAGINLLRNFHVEAGKQEIFGKQYNTLTFEFETEQNKISNNYIETIINGNTEQIFPIPPYPTTLTPYISQLGHNVNLPVSLHNSKILNHRRNRRSLENKEIYLNKFRQNKQIEENSINNSVEVEVLEDHLQSSETSADLSLQNSTDTNPETAVENTNLSSSSIPPTTTQKNIESAAYNYNKPTIITPHHTYGTPPLSDNSYIGYDYPQQQDPLQNNPNLSYGPPIYNLSPPSQQDPQQFRPPMYGLPNHWFSLSDSHSSNINNGLLYQLRWPFCLSYQKFPVTKFKPSLPDFNRDYFETYYNNYNGYKPNNDFFTNWF